jgi:hypothetical protein
MIVMCIGFWGEGVGAARRCGVARCRWVSTAESLIPWAQICEIRLWIYRLKMWCWRADNSPRAMGVSTTSTTANALQKYKFVADFRCF